MFRKERMKKKDKFLESVNKHMAKKEKQKIKNRQKKAKELERRKKQAERWNKFRSLMSEMQRRAQMMHFKKRLLERAGINTNEVASLTNEVLALVETGRLALVPRRHINDYECYEVHLKMLEGIIVYDPINGTLVTYLPDERQHA